MYVYMYNLSYIILYYPPDLMKYKSRHPKYMSRHSKYESRHPKHMKNM